MDESNLWILAAAGAALVGYFVGRVSRRTSAHRPSALEASLSRGTLPEEQPAEGGASSAEIEAALKGGRKIEAIKLYRETFGVGLKQAKEAVEAMEARLRG